MNLSLNDLLLTHFEANGFQGQYVLVVPSHDLVVMRLGASLGPTGIWQLLGDLILAMNGINR